MIGDQVPLKRHYGEYGETCVMKKEDARRGKKNSTDARVNRQSALEIN